MQLALFDSDLNRPYRGGDTCGTCGTKRPDDFAGALWLEPVSGECFECNHKTLAEMFHGDPQARTAAWARHHRGVSSRKRKRPA